MDVIRAGEFLARSLRFHEELPRPSRRGSSSGKDSSGSTSLPDGGGGGGGGGGGDEFLWLAGGEILSLVSVGPQKLEEWAPFSVTFLGQPELHSKGARGCRPSWWGDWVGLVLSGYIPASW